MTLEVQITAYHFTDAGFKKQIITTLLFPDNVIVSYKYFITKVYSYINVVRQSDEKKSERPERSLCTCTYIYSWKY